MADTHSIFLLALPLACILFLGIVTKPKWVVIFLIFSRVLLDPFLNTTKTDSGGIGFGAVLNVLVILVTVFLGLKNYSAPFFRSGFFKSWILFLGVCLAAVVYSPFPMMGARGFSNLLSYLCMAMLPSLIDPEKNDKKFWIKALLFSSIAPVIIANIDLARGGRVFEDAGSRIMGSFTHPNILGFYLVWLVVLVAVVFKSGLFRLSWIQKGLLSAYTLNIVALLIATRTRNAWICVWLLFFFYGIFKERKYILFSIGVLFAGFFLSGVASRMTDLFEAGGARENSFSWRLQVWKDSFASIGERWIFGHGLGSFRALSSDFLTQNKKGAEAHSVVVQLLFEMGLAGLLSYLLIYGILFREFCGRIKKTVFGLSKEYALVTAYLVVYLVSGIADNLLSYLALNWYCWFFFGVILKSMRFQRPVTLEKI